MLNVALNITGLILILYSIYVIRKDLLKEKVATNNLNEIEERVKEYYNLTEEIVESFDEMIDSKLEMINLENRKSYYDQIHHLNNENNNKNSNINSNHDNLNPFHKKIIELYSIGLTKEEIAKKLNKGIREIEIVLKIYANNKTDKFIQK